MIAEASANWQKAGWDAVDPMAAATSITRSHQIILGRINEALAPLDLTFSRYEALVLLAFSRTGALPLGKVGGRLQVHPTSVTNTIDRLEEDGLANRVPHPSDRRATLAEITKRGRDRLEKATRALVDIRYGMGDLDDSQASALVNDLRPLREGVSDRFF